MYLSRLHLQNWRTYADALFEFKPPTSKRSVVLIGAMNGHGKTSFLISLYLGLFGRYGLRHCEGFGGRDEDDFKFYREAVSKFRRNSADPDEPTVIDITLSPSDLDNHEAEVRVVRRWFFSSNHEPRQGGAFEEVDVYLGERLQKPGSFDKDPILLAQERIERNLFPAHVAPAFFFDGEQAQKLVESAGESGLKRAVEVMFGTKVLEELLDTMNSYLVNIRQKVGGKKKTTDQQVALESKLAERAAINAKIAKCQAHLGRLEDEKEHKERQRSQLQEELARLGGAFNINASQVQTRHVADEREQADASKALGDKVRDLGLSLATGRLAPAIRNRLKAEEQREDWESLMRGTLDNRDKVLAVAMPDPDPLLGNILEDVRDQIRQRFSDALERIYNPPPSNCAQDYLLGHVKGDARVRVLTQLGQVQAVDSGRIKTAAKRLRDAREAYEETKRQLSRVENLPKATKDIKEALDSLNSQIQEHIRHIGQLENEEKVLKAQLSEFNRQIGDIQEDLARLGPEQKRIAIAERVCRSVEELKEQLQPTTSKRLEEAVSKHFRNIADKRFRNSYISLATGSPPQVCFNDGREPLLLEVNSGFERRAFGIAFTLALAEITQRRLPLVIDTPLGNADSEYRPRTLRALAGFDLDQIIILTHDEEVTTELAEGIKGQISQKFLVRYEEESNLSCVYPDTYFA